MSKITCEYDSVEKTFKIAVDGKELESVTSFLVFGGDDYCDPYCTISQCVKDDVNGISTHMNTTATSSPEGKKAVSAGHKVGFLIPGFVTYPGDNSINTEILKYFTRK